METDNYGYLTFHTPELDEPCSTEFSLSFVYPYDYIPLRCCDFSKKTKQVKLEKEFFESSCKMNNDGTRSLILDGKDIYQKIGLYNRYFQYLRVTNLFENFHLKNNCFSGDVSKTRMFLFC